jgi:ribosomal protein S12 methylthiotransferase
MSAKSFYIENLGCSKNQVDAEIMVSALLDRDWTFHRHEPELAEFIIINTCGFIASAKEEAINTILSALNEYPEKKIIAAGCMAQRYGRELKEQIPKLAAVFGNKIPEDVADFLENIPEEKILMPRGKVLFPTEKIYSLSRVRPMLKLLKVVTITAAFAPFPL